MKVTDRIILGILIITVIYIVYCYFRILKLNKELNKTNKIATDFIHRASALLTMLVDERVHKVMIEERRDCSEEEVHQIAHQVIKDMNSLCKTMYEDTEELNDINIHKEEE